MVDPYASSVFAHVIYMVEEVHPPLDSSYEATETGTVHTTIRFHQLCEPQELNPQSRQLLPKDMAPEHYQLTTRQSLEPRSSSIIHRQACRGLDVGVDPDGGQEHRLCWTWSCQLPNEHDCMFDS